MQDVANGWTYGFRDAGAQVAAHRLDNYMNFYAASYTLGLDGEYRKSFDEDAIAALSVDGLFAEVFKGWPDVVYVVSAFFLPQDVIDLIKSRGIRVVLHYTESPYEDDQQLAKCATADLVLVNDPTNLAKFQAVNPNTYYQPHCYDPRVHKPGPPVADLRSEFCFVGTGYPSRQRFFEAVDWSGINFALAGNWDNENSSLSKHLVHPPKECADNSTETVDLYRSTKVSANLYRKEANRPWLETGWSVGPREVELAAMGVFFLRESRGEGDELFPNLPVFDGPQDFEQQLRWWLDHPVERACRAVEARDAVEDRSFGLAARRVMQLLDT